MHRRQLFDANNTSRTHTTDELAYRRGAHQTACLVVDLARGHINDGGDLASFERLAVMLSDILDKYRFDRDEHPVLLDDAETELYTRMKEADNAYSKPR